MRLADEKKADAKEEIQDDADDDIEPLAAWKAKEQEWFRAQPKETKQWLVNLAKRSDADYQQKMQELAPLSQVQTKWSNYFAQMGLDGAQAFDALVTADYQLRAAQPEQRKQLFAHLAQSYGVDLSPPADGEEPLPLDPNVQALQQQVAQLTQQLQGNQQAAYQSRETEISSDIEAFKSAKGEDGSLAHPYFDEVEPDMARLAQFEIQSGRQPTVADLYATAVLINPEVKAKVESAERAAAEKKLKAEQAEKVKKAERANGSIAGRGTEAPEEQPKTAEEAARRAYEQLENAA